MPPREAGRGLPYPGARAAAPGGDPRRSIRRGSATRRAPGAVAARWKPIGIQSQLKADRRLLRASLTSGLFARGSAESASECHSPTLPSDSQVPTRPLTPERKHPVAIICPMPTSHVVLVVRVPIHDVRIVPVHRPIVSACTYGGATAHATPLGTGALRWPRPTGPAESTHARLSKPAAPPSPSIA